VNRRRATGGARRRVDTSVKQLFLLGLTLVAGGCFSRSGECETDADCDGVCARTGDCVDSAIAVTVEWTVAGAAPTAESCAPVAELEVVFYADDREQTSYAPVPCTLGRTNYDKMPPWLDRVDLVAHDDDGRILDIGHGDIAPTGATTVTIDLQP
jgi:hypothetical protein